MEICQEKSHSKGKNNLKLHMVHEKKVDWTLWGKLTVHGCSQTGREHYNSSLLHAPITNDGTICIMLTLMLMTDLETWVIEVKGSLLHERPQDGEKKCMKVPKEFKNFIVQMKWCY